MANNGTAPRSLDQQAAGRVGEWPNLIPGHAAVEGVSGGLERNEEQPRLDSVVINRGDSEGWNSESGDTEHVVPGDLAMGFSSDMEFGDEADTLSIGAGSPFIYCEEREAWIQNEHVEIFDDSSFSQDTLPLETIPEAAEEGSEPLDNVELEAGQPGVEEVLRNMTPVNQVRDIVTSPVIENVPNLTFPSDPTPLPLIPNSTPEEDGLVTTAAVSDSAILSDWVQNILCLG